MANDTTAAGFLTPVSDPQHDQQLDDALHSTIQGVVGRVPATLVRPRWQPEPPNRPNSTTDWIAFGVVRSEPDVFAYEGHEVIANGDGSADSTIVERDELVYVLVSFFGPNAAANDARLRAGLDLAQNRNIMRNLNIGFVEYQAPVRVPALLKETWVPRVDATLVLRRRSVHRYQVRSLVGGDGSLDNEQYLTPLKIAPAP